MAADSYIVVRKRDGQDPETRILNKVGETNKLPDADQIAKALRTQEPTTMFYVYKVDGQTGEISKVLAVCGTADAEPPKFPGGGSG